MLLVTCVVMEYNGLQQVGPLLSTSDGLPLSIEAVLEGVNRGGIDRRRHAEEDCSKN